MKKIFSVLFAVVLTISLVSITFAADKTNTDYTLMFDEGGKLKILLLADVQDEYPFMEAEVEFIEEVLDETTPDMVVFGGDNILGTDLRAYEQLLSPLVARGIPFTFVFGNHDGESSDLSLEETLDVYQQYDGCLAYDADPDLHGCATHNLEVKSSDGTKTAFNLWLFDSGNYVSYSDGSGGYDCVRENQIEWYKTKSLELQVANGGELVPSLAFQHIIVREVYDALYSKTTNRGDKTKNFQDGTSYNKTPNPFKFDGIIQSTPSPSSDNEGEWDAFVERGDVLGCITGHDHTNSFVANYKGVDIIQCPATTYYAHGNTNVRGATLFTIDENNLFEYEREVITAGSLAIKKGSNLPGLNDISYLEYYFTNVWYKIMTLFSHIIQF